MNNQGVASQFVGAIVIFAIGVVSVAAIYQLEHPQAGTTGVATSVDRTTSTALGDLYK